MIKNTSGQIALKWTINTNGKTVKMGNTGKYYVFSPKFNVVMSWVDPFDVPALLSKKEKTCNCNNGTYKQAFEYAHLLDVNLWMTGDRYGNGVERTWMEVS
jgi:hypothetical protein